MSLQVPPVSALHVAAAWLPWDAGIGAGAGDGWKPCDEGNEGDEGIAGAGAGAGQSEADAEPAHGHKREKPVAGTPSQVDLGDTS
mmetsp:Transcript_36150/g.83979  ORF Transcript_36150/g.83979 Transcript_36150/m.83979 type:complete len:85 (-) Transcript_36150:512-766(-)